MQSMEKRNNFLEFFKKTPSIFGLVAIVVLASFISVRNGQNLFLSPINIANVVRAVSENGIIAIGMTLVILIGGIDLSVAAILGLAATAAADLMMHRNLGVGLTLLVVLGMCMLFGVINGIVSTKLGVQAFIATLATQSIARGLARFWSGGIGIPISYGEGEGLAPQAFDFFGDRIYGIPVPAICFLVISVIFYILLKHTRFGRYIYAIGGNETAAYLSAINVDRIKIIVFMIAGFLAGFAGIIHAAQIRQGSPNDGMTYELSAIAAAAIGGTSIAGGKGTIIGTVIGVLILGVLDNMLGLKNVNNNLQMILKGVIIIITVVLQREKKK